MALTQIENGMITDGILTTGKLNTTGTASSTTVLKGDFSWGTGATTSGKWNVADSAPGTPVAGDIWYAGGIVYITVDSSNTTGAWSSTGSLLTGYFGDSGCGTQAAGLVAGGSIPSGATDRVEEYSGSIWSAGTTLPTLRQREGTAGTQTASWVSGGRAGPAPNLATTDEYDGTSWAAGGSLSVGRWLCAGIGTLSAGQIVGGMLQGIPTTYNTTEEYDGTSWTSGGNLGTGRYELACCGILTSGLAIAGEGTGPVGYLDTTEEYNGTAWSAGGTLVAMDNKGNGAAGSTQTAAITFGGNNGGVRDDTEEYDGTTWTVAMRMDRTRASNPGGFGSKTAAVCAGGDAYPNPALSSCIEWNYTGHFNPKGTGYS